MTERLYLNDPWLRDFEATVTAHSEYAGRASVLLERSAFYPESGGQMADRGKLADLAVSDVQQDAEGRVHHMLDGERPAIGQRVQGSIDGGRRRVHMAQHTGQHLLSRALLEVAKADTLSSRLGETACTLDIPHAKLADGLLARAEALVNAVIDDDIEVETLYPNADELARLKLRRASKVEDNIRVIKVGDFDVTPCGGTHCTRSSQIGLLSITNTERHKGGLRLSFMAGQRARQRLTRDSVALAQLSKRFSCGPTEVDAAVAKLEQQAQLARKSIGGLQERLADELALRHAQQASEGLLVLAFDDLDAQVVRRLAGALTKSPGCAVALAAVGGDAVQVVIARSADHELDCGALLRKVATACGGRGGGRPQRAEGRLPAGIDWTALVGEAQ